MKAESSMGALPSPAMSRAPSKTVTRAAGAVWLSARGEHAEANGRHAARRIANAVFSVRNSPVSIRVTSRRGGPEGPSLLKKGRGVPLRHVADGDLRHFLHRLDV